MRLSKRKQEDGVEFNTAKSSLTISKKVLAWDDPILLNPNDCNTHNERFSFFKFLDDIPSLSEAEKIMTDEHWKFLYALVRNVTKHSCINYCVYKNQNNLLFDVTTQRIDFNEDTVLHKNIKTKTEAEQLQNLKDKKDNIEFKMKNLQEEHTQVLEEIKSLLQKLGRIGGTYEQQ